MAPGGRAWSINPIKSRGAMSVGERLVGRETAAPHIPSKPGVEEKLGIITALRF